MPDRIEETLRTLSRDIDAVPLPDSGAVRRRGDQRTRHQVVGAGIAAVAVLAGVAGLAGGLPGRTTSAPPATNGPTVATTQRPLLDLAADPYLRDGDLRDVGPFESFLNAGRQPTGALLQCIDVEGSAQSAKRTSTVLYEPEIGEPTVHEHVLRFPSFEAATAFVDSMSESFASCDPGDPAQARVIDRGPYDVEGGFVAFRETTPTADAGIGYYEVGVMQNGNIVVVLEWSSMGNPFGPSGFSPSKWVWTTDRLRLALQRATG